MSDDPKLILRPRTPADFAELLPYLLGMHPGNSIVLFGLHGPQGQAGAISRLDLPHAPADWPQVATALAEEFVTFAEQRDNAPEAVIIYLCQEPEPGETGADVTERLELLANHLTVACTTNGTQVLDALCLSAGHWWSYTCHDPDCCTPTGTPLRSRETPGPVTAAFTYAGSPPLRTEAEITATFQPITGQAAATQRTALDRAARTTTHNDTATTHQQAGVHLDTVMTALQDGAADPDSETTAQLLTDLQDRHIRDRAAEYAEQHELPHAHRLWSHLARHCVPPYDNYAAAPLTLLGWTAWRTDDKATARLALHHALQAQPGYQLAELLLTAVNEGVSPEPLLDMLREQRAERRNPTGSD